MIQQDAQALDDLLRKAREVAKGLHGVADGKPPEAVTQSNAKTFATVASMLNALSDAAHANRDAERWRRALTRIANLEVRGAANLLERQDWGRMTTELQAIAQDGLNGLRSH